MAATQTLEGVMDGPCGRQNTAVAPAVQRRHTSRRTSRINGSNAQQPSHPGSTKASNGRRNAKCNVVAPAVATGATAEALDVATRRSTQR